MKLITAGFLFVILAAFASPGRVGKEKINKFKWLNGSWKMVTKRGMIIESWMTKSDSRMQGKSVFVKNETDTTVLENVSLVYSNKKYYYIPTATGQNNNNPVSFEITSFSEKGFIAENPEHDFPKRITYQLINTDSIHAFIDGGPAMPDKKSNFYYSRIKN